MTTSTMTAPITTAPNILAPVSPQPSYEPCAQTMANIQLKAAPVETDPASGVAKETYADQHPIARWWNQIIGAIYSRYADDRGMSTIEYALGCVAAAALGALLYTVVTSDTVEQALSGIFEKALNTK
ncbi:DUF4244 domain-containing protein [Corynebacterium macclintockiae]|uniref:DUF4244 domain-containing protein n=1 Tax=Corynebacterium macclintockiae TaxID=2913501 RepID=UPI003EBAA736